MTTLLWRTNPLVLLLIGMTALVGSFAVRDLRIGLVTLTVYAVAAVVLVPSWSQVRGRALLVAIASLSVVWSTWLVGGREVDTAVTAGLRILVLALPGAVLAAMIDPAKLGDQLGQRLHLPARMVVANSAALQRFERFTHTWQQLGRTRRIRGYGAGRSPASRLRLAGSMTFGLLVSALRDAHTMSTAMDARGFAHASTRTWAEPAPWTRLDTAVLAGGLAVTLLPIGLAVAW